MPQKQSTGVINGGVASYSSTNTVYVDYKNSQYGVIQNGQVASYVGLPTQLYANAFTLSEEPYDYLTGEFNQQMDFYENYTGNKFQEIYDDVEDEVVIESIMFSLTCLFTAQIVAFCFVPVFAGHIPVYMVLLALGAISFIGQAAILGLLVDKKLNPLKKFKDNCNDIKNNTNLNNLVNTLNTIKDQNYLCRYNEDKEIAKTDYENGLANFKSKTDFFGQVLPAMEHFQTLARSQDYQEFHNVIKAKDITPEKYEEKMQP
ncbi:MAG: hypothetical protein MJ233_05625 [Mycoplasmoidaceae bacterium]|nr:hypothetical protein [Mycoplasmoidaceae bacterium]